MKNYMVKYRYSENWVNRNGFQVTGTMHINERLFNSHQEAMNFVESIKNGNNSIYELKLIVTEVFELLA